MCYDPNPSTEERWMDIIWLAAKLIAFGSVAVAVVLAMRGGMR